MAVTQKQVKSEVKKAVKKHQDQIKEQLQKLEKNLDSDIENSEKDVYSRLLEKTKNQAKQKTLYIHTKFKEHSSTAIIAALSLLIALSWKDLVIKVVDNFLKKYLVLENHPYLSNLITSIIITLLAIIAIAFVSRWAKKPEEKI